jgi:hypothetical protein
MDLSSLIHSLRFLVTIKSLDPELATLGVFINASSTSCDVTIRKLLNAIGIIIADIPTRNITLEAESTKWSTLHDVQGMGVGTVTFSFTFR